MNKQQIKQQIEDLKANLEALKRELNKPSKFRFSYPLCPIHISEKETFRSVCEFEGYSDNFRYRQTEENAKADFQLQKELMCIGALAEQIDPDYKSKVIWNGFNSNHTVVFNLDYKKYETITNHINKYLGVVYMPKDVAKKVCEILNNKEVVF